MLRSFSPARGCKPRARQAAVGAPTDHLSIASHCANSFVSAVVTRKLDEVVVLLQGSSAALGLTPQHETAPFSMMPQGPGELLKVMKFIGELELAAAPYADDRPVVPLQEAG
jgi:hypothetical protein